jgi:tetratricopeptide (TPR) repeat protein
VLALWYEWNWSAAEEGFRRVLCANPGDAMSHGNYAFLLMSRRRFDDSIREIKQALTIDPLMPLFYAWSMPLHNAAGRYDEALEEFAKVMQIDPTSALAYFHAGMALARQGFRKRGRPDALRPHLLGAHGAGADARSAVRRSPEEDEPAGRPPLSVKPFRLVTHSGLFS